ncbi:MAG: hypothetical protein AAGK04_11940 [Planctomycetota bacterium]
MRLRLAIPLLLLWLLAPTGGLGMVLHGWQHELAATQGTADAEPSGCGACCSHSMLDASQPDPSREGSDESHPSESQPGEPQDESPECRLCEVLLTAITLSPEWHGPSPVVASEPNTALCGPEERGPARALVAARSRGPPIV